VTEAEFTFVAVGEDGRPANWPVPSRRPSPKKRDNRARRANLSGKPTGGYRPVPDRILVINPNSTDSVTRAIDGSLCHRLLSDPGLFSASMLAAGCESNTAPTCWS